MTALAADKQNPQRRDGNALGFPVAASACVYAGALACVNAAGYALAGSDTAALIFEGVADEQKDNSAGSNGDLTVTLLRRGLFKCILDTVITQANVGDNVFLVDDQSVDLTGNVSHGIYCGVIAGYIDTTHAWIDIEPAIAFADIATHIADASAAHAASAISIADAGAHTAQTEAEAAMQEIYQHILTTKGHLSIPMPVITEAGVALAVFANASSATPGFCATAKGMGIRWNNHANPGGVAVKIPVPPDADVAANMTLNILAAKVGATEADAVTFTVLAYNNDVDALYDADVDFGGATSAMGGTTATKTIQHVTLTLALANLTAYPAAIELVINPTDGKLETDDVILLAAWIDYQRKLLTA